MTPNKNELSPEDKKHIARQRRKRMLQKEEVRAKEFKELLDSFDLIKNPTDEQLLEQVELLKAHLRKYVRHYSNAIVHGDMMGALYGRNKHWVSGHDYLTALKTRAALPH